MARQSDGTLRQMSYFIAVSESGSFRRAADSLEITQPTLTSQIATLEERLGLVLFERSRSGATMSPAGRELLPLSVLVLGMGIVGSSWAAIIGLLIGGAILGIVACIAIDAVPEELPVWFLKWAFLAFIALVAISMSRSVSSWRSLRNAVEPRNDVIRA